MITTAARLALLFGTLTSTVVAQTPPPRAGHVMTSAGPGGGVWLVGGQIIDDAPRVADTLWLWTGSAWRPVSDDGPRSRTLPAAAFDSRRGMLVVYGGVGIGSGTRYGDTWEWNGRRWEDRGIQTPGPRDHHAMVYDEARAKVVMYGGAGPAGRPFLADTWTFDGTVWQRADSTSGPGGLVHHAMAYDARRQRVVLFGGFDDTNRRTTDTWEWDGARWERAAVSGPAPSARSHHRMAYDAARGVTVLFGGGRTGETWTWDGAQWKQYAVPGPPGRDIHAMAYDARRERVMMFGGGNGDGVPPYGYLNDLWEWDGARWLRVPAPR
jgi:hypothetical protein